MWAGVGLTSGTAQQLTKVRFVSASHLWGVAGPRCQKLAVWELWKICCLFN